MLLFHLPLEWIFAVFKTHHFPLLHYTCFKWEFPSDMPYWICVEWQKSVQLGNIFKMFITQHCDIYSVMLNCYWSLSPLVRERRPLSRMLSDLVLKLKTSGCTHVTANWTNLVHWKVLYMVYFLLLHWSEFLYQSLHKLNEWMTTFTVRFYRPHSWHLMQHFYTELPVLIFYFPLYFLYLFHMKYLYRISMCEAKTPTIPPLLDMVLICTFTQRKYVTAIIILFYEFKVSNIFLNVILTVRNSG